MTQTTPNVGKESVPITGEPDGQMTPLEIHQNQGFSSPDEPGKKLEKEEPTKDNIEQHIPNRNHSNIDQGGVD